MAVPVKLVEYSGDGEIVETNLLNVDEDVYTNYEYLRAKIATTINNSTTFNIFWKDDENDLIVISSDNELFDAITHATTERLDDKLTLYIRQTHTATTTQPSVTHNPDQPLYIRQTHTATTTQPDVTHNPDQPLADMITAFLTSLSDLSQQSQLPGHVSSPAQSTGNCPGELLSSLLPLLCPGYQQDTANVGTRDPATVVLSTLLEHCAIIATGLQHHQQQQQQQTGNGNNNEQQEQEQETGKHGEIGDAMKGTKHESEPQPGGVSGDAIGQERAWNNTATIDDVIAKLMQWFDS